jgi:NADPH-dependent 2,4-dienoyl-CoA reductase/sulfur reductase-like enzyme
MTAARERAPRSSGREKKSPPRPFRYILVGGGVAAAAAIQGIRRHDPQGSILLIGREPYLPYHRPPLTKELWYGKKSVEAIFFEDEQFYRQQQVEIKNGLAVRAVNLAEKTVCDSGGGQYCFEKLLLATGATPTPLPLIGSSEGRDIIYLRSLGDYLRLSSLAEAEKAVLIIGGGFIGTEIAAALAFKNLKVSLLFADDWPCGRLFGAALGGYLAALFESRNVELIAADRPVVIERRKSISLIQTARGRSLSADMIVAAVGSSPEVELAQMAGLSTARGIVTDRFLQSSHPDVYAAGDAAVFPHSLCRRRESIDHWDNALAQGRCAGANMAGAQQPYDYEPYFFGGFFDWNYEAIGAIDSRLTSYADWQQQNQCGVIYYLDQDNRPLGVLLCNLPGRIDAARNLLGEGQPRRPAELKGAIR